MITRPKIKRTVDIHGTTIPGVIKNGDSYFFTDIEVYADGLVYCWEMVDFNILKMKLKNKWVSVSVPDNEFLSIHHVGNIKIKNANWLYSSNQYLKYIMSIVKKLNPKMENIFNCYGQDTKTINGVRYGWPLHGSPKSCLYDSPLTPLSELSLGDSMWLILKKDTKCYLGKIEIFEGGRVRVSGTPETKIYKFDEFINILEKKDVFARPKIGERMEIVGLGEFEIGEESEFFTCEELRGEIEDMRDRVKGEPGKVQTCFDCFLSYTNDPTRENHSKLKSAYEKVPDHLKMYCGDMDTKDIPIRMVLYGKAEIENWSHYQIAKEEGVELPTINVPDAKE